MTNITIAVPDDLHGRMKEMSEIRWSEVARKAFEKKVNELEAIEKIARKSKLTKKDVDEIAELIDRDMTKKILQKCG